MKNKILLTILGLTLCSSGSLKAQVALPYFSGFDDVTQQTGWTEYKKADTTFSNWGYEIANAYSAPNCIGHDFSPSSGITVTDNWYVSPAFSISGGGMLDSLRYKFVGFSEPMAGDTIAVYLLNGSQDPDLATSTQLLFDFRGTAYVADNTYKLKTNISLPAMGGLSYIALRYRNSDCSSNWLNVFFDNVAITGTGGAGVGTLNAVESNLSVFPNPSEGLVQITSETGLNSIEITNSIGEVIYSKNDCNGQATVKVDLSLFASGLYLVKNSNEMTSQFYKLILK
ncbi:MAG: choice-of-anchor J domain-containing protein [Crocinitomicaceae bacterium]|nr:choice-of-anchor J domain-containing protein [Crocinitomicaceae bacterium]